MQKRKISKDLALSVLVFVFVLTLHLGWGLSYYDSFRTKLNVEKLKNDSILSTKLLLNKTILKLNQQLNKKQSNLNKVSFDLTNNHHELKLANDNLLKIMSETCLIQKKNFELSNDIIFLTKKYKLLKFENDKLQIKLGVNDMNLDTLFKTQ